LHIVLNSFKSLVFSYWSIELLVDTIGRQFVLTVWMCTNGCLLLWVHTYSCDTRVYDFNRAHFGYARSTSKQIKILYD